MTKTMCCYLTIGNDNNNMNSKLLQRKNITKKKCCFVPEMCVTFILYTSRNLNCYIQRERERGRSTLQMHMYTPKYMPAVEIKANNYSLLSTLLYRLVINTCTHTHTHAYTQQANTLCTNERNSRLLNIEYKNKVFHTQF